MVYLGCNGLSKRVAYAKIEDTHWYVELHMARVSRTIYVYHAASMAHGGLLNRTHTRVIETEKCKQNLTRCNHCFTKSMHNLPTNISVLGETILQALREFKISFSV